MRWNITRLLLIVLAFACGVFSDSGAGHAQTRLNLVMMGEDFDPLSVARSNRIFNRVQLAIMEEMNTRSYQVYDEVAVSMAVTSPGRIRRMDAELIEVARTIKAPPLDVLTIFQIHAAVRTSPMSDIKRVNVRVSGRMLNVRTGQSLGSFEVVGQDLPPLPPGCGTSEDCILEHVGNEAKPIGIEVAAALADKLAAFLRPASPAVAVNAPAGAPLVSAPAGPACPGLPTAYVIKVNQFASQEVMQLEGFLSAFSCFEGMRPIRQSSAVAEYWYESRIDPQRLARNFQSLKDALGVNFQTQISGNTVTLTKIITR